MTRPKLLAFAALLLITITPAAFANIYGAVRGVVHDPQHRPIQNAMVMLRAKSSEWAKSVTTDATGEFQFNAVPLGVRRARGGPHRFRHAHDSRQPPRYRAHPGRRPHQQLGDDHQ